MANVLVAVLPLGIFLIGVWLASINHRMDMWWLAYTGWVSTWVPQDCVDYLRTGEVSYLVSVVINIAWVVFGASCFLGATRNRKRSVQEVVRGRGN